MEELFILTCVRPWGIGRTMFLVAHSAFEYDGAHAKAIPVEVRNGGRGQLTAQEDDYMREGGFDNRGRHSALEGPPPNGVCLEVIPARRYPIRFFRHKQRCHHLTCQWL